MRKFILFKREFKRLFSVTLLVLMTLFTTSCWKDIECPKSGGSLKYVGYDATDLDTVIFYYYERNTDFSNLVDSFLVTKTSGHMYYSNDTFTVSYSPINIKYMRSRDNPNSEIVDLKIISKFDNKTVFLKDFTFTINYQKGGFDPGTSHCTSPINSYNQDGVIINGLENVYIEK